MESFDDRVLNILTAGLFSAHLNLSLAQVSHRHYFAEAQSQFWGFAPPMTIVIGLEKNKPDGSFFPLYRNVSVWSQTFPQR